MTGTVPFFHIGILVDDIEAGIEQYTTLLGLDFQRPTLFDLSSLKQDGIAETAAAVQVAYSVNGPPYYELIEAAGSGLYASANGTGFHHVGVWMDDADATRNALLEKGVRIVAENWMPDGHPITIFTEPSPGGRVRVEYVNRRYEEIVEYFLKTGRFPEH